MAKRKDKKSTETELLNKLNSKINDQSTARFLNIKETTPGRYELVVEMSDEKANEFIKSEQGKVHPRIRPLKPGTGTALEHLKQDGEIKSLHKALQIGLLKEVSSTKPKTQKEASNLNIRYRDRLDDIYVEAREPRVEELDALKLYDRSAKEYYRTGIYGTHLDLLSNFAATGFYNEINNPDIKEFFDAWVKDVDFLRIIKNIFHNLFQYSVCYVLNAKGQYEPHQDGISSIPGKSPVGNSRVGKKARAAYLLNEYMKKTTGKELDYTYFDVIYSKIYGANTSFPLNYSILEPFNIKLQSSGFFNATSITLMKKGMKLLKKTMEQIKEDPKSVSNSVKDTIKDLPNGLKKAVEAGEDYTFTDEEASAIFLRKNDFETYSKPKGSRAFDSFDYKDELKKADFATVDGIYNYILKITVGNDQFPVTDETILDQLAEAFNTPQKAFAVVWNHTLNIEKITATEVGNILGKEKYEPVEEDITMALGFARAIVDGKGLTGDGAILITKSLQSEINAAREVVKTWIYNEYKSIAIAAGFDTYPVVRWKESVLTTDSDAVTRASYMQMLDRKALSHQTYMRENNLDYDTEVQRLKEELPLIQEDILRAGSPYQGGFVPTTLTSPTSGDSGRPKGQPVGEKQPVDKIKTVKDKTKVKTPSQAATEEADNINDPTIKALVLKMAEELREQENKEIAANKEALTILNTPLKGLIE